VERESAQPSLHRLLMRALVRGAQAQEDSRLIVAQHAAVDDEVIDTLAATRRGREERARMREVRIRTRR
jgi:hypothetical protein